MYVRKLVNNGAQWLHRFPPKCYKQNVSFSPTTNTMFSQNCFVRMKSNIVNSCMSKDLLYWNENQIIFKQIYLFIDLFLF